MSQYVKQAYIVCLDTRHQCEADILHDSVILAGIQPEDHEIDHETQHINTMTVEQGDLEVECNPTDQMDSDNIAGNRHMFQYDLWYSIDYVHSSEQCDKNTICYNAWLYITLYITPLYASSYDQKIHAYVYKTIHLSLCDIAQQSEMDMIIEKQHEPLQTNDSEVKAAAQYLAHYSIQEYQQRLTQEMQHAGSKLMLQFTL